VLEHNPEVEAGKVELCPNSYEVPTEQRMDDIVLKREIREKYHLPIDKPIFLYGGNLGKPQGIPFLIDCLEANKEREDCHFVVVGDGYDYPKIEKWYNENQPKAVSLFKRLPKADYDKLADACDVGLIFLDHRFTIPNFPSRLLPYLMGKKPVIACTDPHCDTGTIAQANGFGLYCESNSVEAFTSAVNTMLLADRDDMGNKAYQFFLDNYTVEHTYNAVMKHM
jgi:glycosyltransferase involved in cell wall biosynthesis